MYNLEAIYRLLHVLQIKLELHIFTAYFHCIFFAFSTNTVYTTLHLEPWYTWFQVWFHHWHILHIHEFICEFIGHEMSHEFIGHEILSYAFIIWKIWIQIWIYDHEEYLEFICHNSYVWIHLWIQSGEFMIMKSYMKIMKLQSLIHLWIQYYHWFEEYSKIMAEFLEMNSHMKSWFNSLILKYSWFSFNFVSVRKNVLLIQCKHHSFFVVSSLEALRLLCGCCSVAND